MNGHLDVVIWLHENRKEGCTKDAMNSAAMNGHLDIVKFLHENRLEGCSTKAIDWAVINKHLDVVKSLLAYGANIEVQNRYVDTALHYACKQKMGVSNIPIITELLKYGADPNTINNNKKYSIFLFSSYF